MADNLEFATKDKTYTVFELLEDRINSLLARMYDFQSLSPSPAYKDVVEGWRKELVTIRTALYNIAKEEEGSK